MSPDSPRRAPLAAAVIALLVGAAACADSSGDSPDGSDGPASATSSPAAQSPSTPPSTPASASGPSTPVGSQPTTQQAALPVYSIQSTGGDREAVALYRLWEQAPAGAATLEQRLTAALSRTLGGDLLTGLDTNPWDSVAVTAVEVTDARITVTLSGGGVAVTDDRVATLAVQEVVWTAQAVVGQGNRPVRIETAGGAQILGRHASGLEATRPTRAEQWEVLGPIWVTEPSPGATIPRGRAVVFSGEATVHEAALQWRVEPEAGGTALHEGSMTASEGAPGRGTWKVTLPTLQPGSYRVMVSSQDMETGGVAASRAVTFTVQ